MEAVKRQNGCGDGQCQSGIQFFCFGQGRQGCFSERSEFAALWNLINGHTPVRFAGRAYVFSVCYILSSGVRLSSSLRCLYCRGVRPVSVLNWLLRWAALE